MKLVRQMTRSGDRLAACWLGNDGWLFSHEGHMIATDLDFFLEERILPPFPELQELAEALDFLFISHAHTDHFNPGTARLLLQNGPCALVLPESCRACAGEYGIDPKRIIYAAPGRVPLDPTNNPLPLPRAGGTVSPLPGWLGVEAIRALHGHVGGSVYAGASPGDCGYLIRLGGRLIVQPGDSVLLQEHLEIRDADILLVSPTEHNMRVESARHLIESIRPKRVFAQHFGTYRETADNAFWTHGYQRELVDALSPATRERFTIPAYMKPYFI